MGVTMQCRCTRHSLDLTFSGFARFRGKVAELSSREFGEHYKKLLERPIITDDEERKAFYEAFNRETERLLSERLINGKIVDFCLQSDCGGRIRYGACKNIMKAIGDYDDPKPVVYGYAAREDAPRFRDIAELIAECAKEKSDLIWC